MGRQLITLLLLTRNNHNDPIMKSAIIPETYEQWRHCIVVDCGLTLTKAFIDARIAALRDNREHHTQQFVKRYGTQHHQQVLNWFKQAANEI